MKGLKEGGQGAGAGARQRRFRSALVVTEFALSLALLVGAGLLLRSFGRLSDVKPGFDPHNVLLARVWLPVPNNPELDPYRPPAKRVAFVKEVLRRVSALPGVQSAAVGTGNGVPLIGPHNTATLTVEDQTSADNNLPRAQTSAVSPEYFRTLGTPLVRGRFFAESDDGQTSRVALIDEAMAQRFWPNADPVGKRLKFGGRGSNAPWMTVVGIVGNIKTEGLEKPDEPHLYLPIFQNPGYAMAIYLRTGVDPSSLTHALRQQVQAVDPGLPVFGEQPMESLVSESLARRRFAMQVVGLFGALALLLAGIGIYGVMAYAVSERTREVGIRIALGAQSSDVLKLVLGQGMLLALIGVVIGSVASTAVTRFMSGLLFGVTATDPLTFGAVSLLLIAVAFLACYVPARRAARVDPIITLRHEG